LLLLSGLWFPLWVAYPMIVIGQIGPDVEPAGLPAKPCQSRPGEGPEMILIEPGPFRMGSPQADAEADAAERPQHPVTIVRPFAIARCETTVGEFRRFVAETGYRTDAERGDGCYTLNEAGDDSEQRAGSSWRGPGFPQTDAHPVVCVSHRDARAYARWLSLRTGADYRLPTEAEWEYAARGGTTTSRFWGDSADAGCAFANGADRTAKERFALSDGQVMDCDDGALFTAPAGRYRRNAFGLSDMIGNAWEWVEDCWHEGYQGVPSDGSAWLESNGGDCSRRVLRGGSWGSVPRFLRAAGRGGGNADGASSDVGFRLARTLPF